MWSWRNISTSTTKTKQLGPVAPFSVLPNKGPEGPTGMKIEIKRIGVFAEILSCSKLSSHKRGRPNLSTNCDLVFDVDENTLKPQNLLYKCCYFHFTSTQEGIPYYNIQQWAPFSAKADLDVAWSMHSPRFSRILPLWYSEPTKSERNGDWSQHTRSVKIPPKLCKHLIAAEQNPIPTAAQIRVRPSPLVAERCLSSPRPTLDRLTRSPAAQRTIAGGSRNLTPGPQGTSSLKCLAREVSSWVHIKLYPGQ